MNSYSIKDLEHLSGIKAHTLRIWEQRYNIVTPQRTDTNIRYYNDEDLKRILNISLLKENGYKISKIAKLSVEELNHEVIKITENSSDFTNQIQALTVAMIDFREERFEKVLTTNILQQGFENTMINIIYPFLTRIGFLWQTGSINSAQEHFITHLIRQKIMVAIDGQVFPTNKTQKKFLLFLPNGELHEIGLLFANYIIRARGHKVIHLGQSLPFEDLKEAFVIHKPDFIMSIITSVPGQDAIQEYVDNLADTFPDTEILLTGYQVVGQDLALKDNVSLFMKMQDLIDFAEDV